MPIAIGKGQGKGDTNAVMPNGVVLPPLAAVSSTSPMDIWDQDADWTNVGVWGLGLCRVGKAKSKYTKTEILNDKIKMPPSFETPNKFSVLLEPEDDECEDEIESLAGGRPVPTPPAPHEATRWSKRTKVKKQTGQNWGSPS